MVTKIVDIKNLIENAIIYLDFWKSIWKKRFLEINLEKNI